MTKASFKTVLFSIISFINIFICVAFFLEKEWFYFIVYLLFSIFTIWKGCSAYNELPDK